MSFIGDDSTYEIQQETLRRIMVNYRELESDDLEPEHRAIRSAKIVYQQAPVGVPVHRLRDDDGS